MVDHKNILSLILPIPHGYNLVSVEDNTMLLEKQTSADLQEGKNMDKKNKILIEVISGKLGQSLSINNMRVCGSKPLGGGSVIQKWNADRENIIRALGIIEQKNIYT